MKKDKILKLGLGILLSASIASCENDSAQNQELSEALVPEKIISLDKAVREYNNFYNTRIAPFEGKTSSEQIRAVWFDTKTLENYLNNVNSLAKQQNIHITGISFILTANEENQRDIIIAPLAKHPETNANMPFSIDNNKVIFIDDNAFDAYSNLADYNALTDVAQSLLLSIDGNVSLATAIKNYNSYYDLYVEPLSNMVKNDSRFCFYEGNLFRNYLNYIKKQAKENKVDLNGVNIVYGVYDNSPALGEYANHQTLFLTPSITNGKSVFSLTKEAGFSFDFETNIIELSSLKSEDISSSSLSNEMGSSPPIGI